MFYKGMGSKHIVVSRAGSIYADDAKWEGVVPTELRGVMHRSITQPDH